jgi:hypothetical protein
MRVMYGTATKGVAQDARSVGSAQTGQGSLVAEDEWPTTQRFSRRAGEALRGADYAAAVEVPAVPGAGDTTITIVMVIGALLGAAVTTLCHV